MAFREIPLPLKGVDLDSAPSKIPPGFTPSALNMRPFDPMTGKRRLSKRAGVSKYTAARASGLAPVQLIDSACLTTVNRLYVKNTLLLDEDFNDADTDGDAANALGAAWTVRQLTLPVSSATATRNMSTTAPTSAANDPQIDGNAVISPGNSDTWLAIYNTAGFSLSTNAIQIHELDITLGDIATASSTSVVSFMFGMGDGVPTGGDTFRCFALEIAATAGGLFTEVMAAPQGAASDSIPIVYRSSVQLPESRNITLQLHLKFGGSGNPWLAAIYIPELDITLDYLETTSPTVGSATNFVGFALKNIEANAPVEKIDGYRVYSATESSVLSEDVCRVIAVADGDIAVSTDDADFELAVGSIVSGSTGPADIQGRPMGVWTYNGYAAGGTGAEDYLFLLTDGVNYGQFDFRRKTISAWAATTGTLPGSVGARAATIIAKYRNRVLLSGLVSEPSNIFASALADPFDWSYGTSAADAWIASTGNLGAVPDTVTCLAPHSDDLCFVGGTKTLSLIRGDPNLDGVLDNVSSDVGVVGRFAWCRDDEGAMYFVGSQGLYRITGDSGVTMLSRNRLDNFFNSIDYSTVEVSLTWDSLRQGIWIVALNETASNLPAYFWDKRTDSFWPDEYASLMGPSAVHYAPMSGGSTAKTLIGGVDGYVRMVDGTEASDDGTAFTARVDFGPFMAMPNQRIQLQGVRADLCESSGSVNVQIARGATAEQCLTATPQIDLARTGPGRLRPVASNVGGNAIRLRMTQTSATDSMSIERIFLDFDDGGVSTEDV